MTLTSLETILVAVMSALVGALAGLAVNFILQRTQFGFDKRKRTFDLYVTKRQETYMQILDLFDKFRLPLIRNPKCLTENTLNNLARDSSDVISFIIRKAPFLSQEVIDESNNLVEYYKCLIEYYAKHNPLEIPDFVKEMSEKCELTLVKLTKRIESELKGES